MPQNRDGWKTNQIMRVRPFFVVAEAPERPKTRICDELAATKMVDRGHGTNSDDQVDYIRNAAGQHCWVTLVARNSRAIARDADDQQQHNYIDLDEPHPTSDESPLARGIFSISQWTAS